jgi:hypothetical protein
MRTHRVGEAARHDPETDAGRGLAFTMGPFDESLEGVEGRRWGGDVGCYRRIGQQVQQRRGIGGDELAQADRIAFEPRQRHAPTGFVNDVQHRRKPISQEQAARHDHIRRNTGDS